MSARPVFHEGKTLKTPSQVLPAHHAGRAQPDFPGPKTARARRCALHLAPMGWRVINVRSSDPTPGADTAAAAVVTIQRGDDTRQIIVELADSAAASGQSLNARTAVSEYLDSDEPPKRIIVTTDGPRVAE
jgi:hypothetical protein